MVLNTKRLNIIPLSITRMKLLMQSVSLLETDMGLNPSSEILDPEAQHALEFNYNLAVNDPANYLWYTFWVAIDKVEKKIVTNVCFKSKPDEEGRVEIGYGTIVPARNKGYMTESVEAITQWALAQDGVETIMAETETGNVASQRVLMKCGFLQYMETDSSYFWKKKMYTVRPETDNDYAEIHKLIQTAFATAKVKDGNEQEYAANLRKSPKYIPDLALTAERGDELIGHVMFTRLEISLSSSVSEVKALLVAPLSVKLEYRNIGVGSALLRQGFRIAKDNGYDVVFLCGDPEYYKRFGFKESALFHIKNVNGIPDQYSLAYELVPDILNGVTGTIDFH